MLRALAQALAAVTQVGAEMAAPAESLQSTAAQFMPRAAPAQESGVARAAAAAVADKSQKTLGRTKHLEAGAQASAAAQR